MFFLCFAHQQWDTFTCLIHSMGNEKISVFCSHNKLLSVIFFFLLSRHFFSVTLLLLLLLLRTNFKCFIKQTYEKKKQFSSRQAKMIRDIFHLFLIVSTSSAVMKRLSKKKKKIYLTHLTKHYSIMSECGFFYDFSIPYYYVYWLFRLCSIDKTRFLYLFNSSVFHKIPRIQQS